jgi:hypothetical protein
MARPGFVDGADDMLHDMQLVDAASRGMLTPYVLTSIRTMAEFGLTSDLIARQLGISQADVERATDAVYSSAQSFR